MQVIRHKQPGLTRVFPHDGNNRYIIGSMGLKGSVTGSPPVLNKPPQYYLYAEFLQGVNFGYNASLAGDFGPSILSLGDQTINYFGSFGENYANVRTVGDAQPTGYDAITVNISGFGSATLAWSGTRFEGNWTGLAAALKARQERWTPVSIVSAAGGVVTPPYEVVGPFTHNASGLTFWFRWPEGAAANAAGWDIGFNIDNDAEPDVWINLFDFLSQVDNGQKRSVKHWARKSGWTG